MAHPFFQVKFMLIEQMTYVGSQRGGSSLSTQFFRISPKFRIVRTLGADVSENVAVRLLPKGSRLEKSSYSDCSSAIRGATLCKRRSARKRSTVLRNLASDTHGYLAE